MRRCLAASILAVAGACLHVSTTFAEITQAVTLDTTSPRTETLLNFDWQFRPGEVGEDYKPDVMIDDRWQAVQLPHDASIYGPFTHENSDGANGWRPRGCGVYRKMFALPKEAGGKRVLVEFEGVYRDANVSINGEHVAHELNGYLGFEVDLTPYVNLERELSTEPVASYANLAIVVRSLDKLWYPEGADVR